MSDTKTKAVEKIISDLFSSDAKVVDAALKKVPSKGDASMVIPLLRAYKAWEQEPEIKSEIEKILKELKAEDAIPELIEALNDSEFDQERAFIISVFWNSGLFPLTEVHTLVKQAIRGDFMVTLEVLTVIENIESKLDESMVESANDDINDFLDSNQNAPHGELLIELQQVLSNHLEV